MKTLNGRISVGRCRRCRSVLDHQIEDIKSVAGKSPESGPKTEKKPHFCNYKSEMSINRNLSPKRSLSSESNASETQLVPTPKTLKNPEEVLKRNLTKLRSNRSNESASALREVVQISRFNPHLLLGSMPIVYKGTTDLLKSLRPAGARTACQAANELFMNVASVEGPEFEELVHALLQKTSEGNKSLREEASEALDSMIVHVPPPHSLKILLHRRIAAFGPSVRATATKLLACVFSISGGNLDVGEDIKTRLVTTAVRSLQNDCNEVKVQALRLVSMLMRHKDYEAVFRTKIPISALQRINNIMETMRSDVASKNV